MPYPPSHSPLPSPVIRNMPFCDSDIPRYMGPDFVPSTLSSHSPHPWAFLAGLWDPVFLTSYIFGKELLVSVSCFSPPKNANGNIAFPEALRGSAWAFPIKSLAPVLPGYITIPTGEYEVSVLHLLLALIPDLYKELVTSVSPVFSSPTFYLVPPSFKALSLK